MQNFDLRGRLIFAFSEAREFPICNRLDFSINSKTPKDVLKIGKPPDELSLRIERERTSVKEDLIGGAHLIDINERRPQSFRAIFGMKFFAPLTRLPHS